MEFHPAFHLLLKFTVGLQTEPPSADEVLIVAKYLGVELPELTSSAKTSMLERELQKQNGYMSEHLEHDSINDSELYRKSMFVQQVVENNRINRRNRTASER